MANHMINRPVSSRILLAIGSLNHDIEVGHRTPSLATLAFVVEGIRLLQQQLQISHGVSDDAILAVISLWTYEATVAMGFPGEGQEVPESLSNNIQTHLKGLHRSIMCRGGLRTLSPQTLWLLAWNLSTMPGCSPGHLGMVEPANPAESRPLVGADDYSCLPRLLETLASIQQCMSSPQSLCGISDEVSFSPLRRALLRLNEMRASMQDQKSPMARLRKSAALASTLLFIFDILLAGSDPAHQTPRCPQNELLRAQERLIAHGLDTDGSFEKTWSVLMTEREEPDVRLHTRAWGVVEMVNAIKHMKGSTVDGLSELLLGYLLHETRSQTVASGRYESLLVKIHAEAKGLTGLGGLAAVG
jgi:hypothetical protein